MIGIIIALAIFSFVGGSYFGESLSSNNIENFTSEVKSAVSSVEVQEEKQQKSEEAKVDIKVEATSESGNKKIEKESLKVNNFIYPGSQTVSSNSNNLFMKSSDTPAKITDWYKEKIKNENLSATSFVTTTANEKVLNKLVADGDYHVEVEITNNGNSEVEIKVVVSN